MKESKNIILITGNGTRHDYFVKRLNARFPIAAVWTETFSYPFPTPASPQEREAWEWYFTRRRNHESRILESEAFLPAKNEPERHTLAEGALNASETLDAIEAHRPGFIALFGTGLLTSEFLRRFPDRIFNLHVGMPEHYRGSSCNFWPIHELRLEYLGAAVHRVDAGIDSGEVLAEASVSLEEHDDEQSLSAKTWLLGTELMAGVISKWLKGIPLTVLPQKKKRKTLPDERFHSRGGIESKTDGGFERTQP